MNDRTASEQEKYDLAYVGTPEWYAEQAAKQSAEIARLRGTVIAARAALVHVLTRCGVDEYKDGVIHEAFILIDAALEAETGGEDE